MKSLQIETQDEFLDSPSQSKCCQLEGPVKSLPVIAAICCLASITGCSDSNKSPNTAVETSISSACSTLKRYAFDGIPATYIDDGASLLYGLADQFVIAGRDDIASKIWRVIDLTYGGITGQLEAKTLLSSTANQYC